MSNNSYDVLYEHNFNIKNTITTTTRQIKESGISYNIQMIVRIKTIKTPHRKRGSNCKILVSKVCMFSSPLAEVSENCLLKFQYTHTEEFNKTKNV